MDKEGCDSRVEAVVQVEGRSGLFSIWLDAENKGIAESHIRRRVIAAEAGLIIGKRAGCNCKGHNGILWTEKAKAQMIQGWTE